MPAVIFNGPAGRVEGRYSAGKGDVAPIAIILHPHPQFGGTMNNKVVYQLFHAFAKRGFSTLRFNFRGVGRSQGTFDEGGGELNDAAAALDWMQTFNPDAPFCWIAGFSFGAWISMQLLMRRPEIAGFISVAPPANMYDFTFLAPCPSSGLIVQGTHDEVVNEQSVARLAEKTDAQKAIAVRYDRIEGANHFFEGCLPALARSVDKYLTYRLESDPADLPDR